ncbi:MAG: hypothetical protein P1P63_08310 [Treponemataceae bacterium]
MGKREKQGIYLFRELNTMELARGEMLTDKKTIDNLRSRIPLNPLATPEMIQELKGADPVDCIFEVDYREGSNGIYNDSAFESIEKQIREADPFIPAGYGHQSQEAVQYEGRDIYGSVIGALLDTAAGKMYYRIIADKGADAEKIRRWLKNKQIGAVSIWGVPTYSDTGAEIIDYDLFSVDFVPPHREGQKNKAYIGEMEKKELGHNELDTLLQRALMQKYRDYVFRSEVYDSYFIAEYGDDFYKIPYKVQDDKVALGTAEKVRRIIKYEPMEGAMETMTNDALLAEIKARTGDGRLSAEKVAGEMDVKLEDKDAIKELQDAKKELDKFNEAAKSLGLTLDEIIQNAKKSKEAEKQAKEKAEFDKTVEAVEAEKGLTKDGKATGEMVNVVRKFARLKVGMTKEQIAGEMDRVINDPDIQKVFGGKYASTPVSSATNTGIIEKNGVIEF